MQVLLNHIPGLPQAPYSLGVGLFEFITMHDTGVDGDTAANEAKYEHGNWNAPGRQAFVGEFVDHTGAIQVADPRYRQWGAGFTANNKAVHLELCHDNTKNGFQAAFTRWCYRSAQYLIARGLGVTDNGTIRSHRQVSNDFKETDHQDPDEYLVRWNASWADVIKTVSTFYADFEAHAKAGKPVDLSGIPEECITNPLLKSISYASLIRDTPVLARGSQGAAVKTLQLLLNHINKSSLPVDGDFGTLTYGAVRAFQQAHKLVVDGEVGPRTWATLRQAASK